MEMKKILTNSLKKAADKMITASAASMSGYGVEDMPQSMKDRR